MPPFKKQYKDKLEVLSSTDVLMPMSIDLKDFESRRFCCMFTGNMHPMRSSWLNLLSELGGVDCYGVMFDKKINSKHDVMGQYKFCFTPENSFSPGYITEKLVQCRTNKTIPIYWGGAMFSADFNQRSFIAINPADAHDVINKIRIASADIDVYNSYLGASLLGDAYAHLDDELSIVASWSMAL